MEQNTDLTSSTIANKQITDIQYKQEAFRVRERILSEDSRGSMVAHRLIWLLGKAELGNIRQVLDIGSWHLVQSIEFSNIFHNARIAAFEPVPDSYQLCISNLNGLDAQKKNRISIHNIALSDNTGSVPFYAVEMSVKQKIDEGFSSLLKFNGKLKNAYYDEELVQKKIMVQSDTLDNWCRENEVHEIDIIWIDVQGAELLVFQGGGNILKNTRIIMTEVGLKPYYEGHTLKSDIDAFLLTRGFIELKGSFELNGFDYEANTIYIKS